MIKIITSISLTEAGALPRNWKTLPMIPASGTFSSEASTSGSGRSRTVTVDFKVARRVPELSREIILKLSFDDGSYAMVGSDDLPATLTVKTSSATVCTCKWVTPEL